MPERLPFQNALREIGKSDAGRSVRRLVRRSRRRSPPRHSRRHRARNRRTVRTIAIAIFRRTHRTGGQLRFGDSPQAVSPRQLRKSECQPGAGRHPDRPADMGPRTDPLHRTESSSGRSVFSGQIRIVRCDVRRSGRLPAEETGGNHLRQTARAPHEAGTNAAETGRKGQYPVRPAERADVPDLPGRRIAAVDIAGRRPDGSRHGSDTEAVRGIPQRADPNRPAGRRTGARRHPAIPASTDAVAATAADRSRNPVQPGGYFPDFVPGLPDPRGNPARNGPTGDVRKEQTPSDARRPGRFDRHIHRFRTAYVRIGTAQLHQRPRPLDERLRIDGLRRLGNRTVGNRFRPPVETGPRAGRAARRGRPVRIEPELARPADHPAGTGAEILLVDDPRVGHYRQLRFFRYLRGLRHRFADRHDRRKEPRGTEDHQRNGDARRAGAADHRHLFRRRLGQRVLGPLLGLGPEGDLGADHDDRLRGHDAPAFYSAAEYEPAGLRRYVGGRFFDGAAGLHSYGKSEGFSPEIVLAAGAGVLVLVAVAAVRYHKNKKTS